MKTIILSILSLLLIRLISTAQTVVSNSIILDEAAKKGTLPNGFTYYIKHNATPQNRVVMYLVNKVGAILEDDNQQGLAHFTEHMSFNGTKNFPKNDLVDYLQKSGVRFGADLNAYTGFDETVYQLPLPLDNPALLDGGLKIMRDWAQDALMDSLEIEKERGVVLEEKRLREGGVSQRMQQKYWPMLTNYSRYSYRMPIGIDSILRNFKPETIRKFYQDWYRPDLQALIIVGDIDVNQVEEKIKRVFADLTNPRNERVRPLYTVGIPTTAHFMVITDKEQPAIGITISSKHDCPSIKTEADLRKNLIKRLFNRMASARYENWYFKPDKTPVISGGSFGITSFMQGTDEISVNAVIKPDEFEQGLKSIWREEERIRRYGFTNTELDRAKTTLLNSEKREYNERDKIESVRFVEAYKENFLNGNAAPSITNEYKLYNEIIPTINSEEINDIIKEYMMFSNKAIIITAPEQERIKLPDSLTVNNWLKDIANENITPYRDSLFSKPILSAEPRPGTVVKIEKHKDVNITTLTLSNGLKVIIKPTAFENDHLLFYGFSPVGTSLVNDQDYYSAAFASTLVAQKGGVGNYNAVNLSNFMHGKGIEIFPYIGENGTSVNGSTIVASLETTLQLIHGYFREPRKDTLAARKYLQDCEYGLSNNIKAPQQIYSDSVNATLYNNNIRRTDIDLNRLKKVDFEKAFKLYQDFFSDASNYTFFFVGNIDTARFIPLINKYLGSLPSTYLKRKSRDLKIDVVRGKIAKTIYKGNEQKATVNLFFTGKFDFSSLNAMRLDALKECLQIRLIQKLREEESEVYSPGVSVQSAKLPHPQYVVAINFGCAPENVDKLIKLTMDEIEELKKTGPPLVNVQKWRKEEKASYDPKLNTNAFWLGYLLNQVVGNEKLDDFKLHDKNRLTIKPLDVRDMAIKYLSGDNYIRMVLLPEKIINQPN